MYVPQDCFNLYVELLSPLSHLFTCEARVVLLQTKLHDYVHYLTLTPIQILGGRASSSLVRYIEKTDKLYVFKAVDFG